MDDPVPAPCRPSARRPRPAPSAFDLIVIGAGSAGFSAALTAAEQDRKVALVGYGTIGGTCVNVGCVPSKSLIRAADALHQATRADRFAGLDGAARLTDWQALRHQKDGLVAQLRQTKYGDLLSAYPTLYYLQGRARLVEGGISLNGKRLKADKIIIATGAVARVPDVAGLNSVPYLTSTSALDLEDLPDSLLVMGGGYIGCELAQMFARLGVGVTIVTRSRLLPDAEPEISQALTGYFAEEGIRVAAGLSYERVEQTARGIELRFNRNGRQEVLTADQILLATGRRAQTEGLGLARAGIELNPDGSIKTDDYMQTSRDGVYAAGDVTGRDPFVYMAAYGAKLAARNAFEGDHQVYDNSAMPRVVFTDPQVAGVGLSERQAKDRGIAVKSSVLSLDNLPRALAAHDTRGLIKLVAESPTGRLLGAQILAPEGGDSIQTAAMAIRQGMTVQALGSMIFPYLTTVEGLKLAAQTFDRDVKLLSCCAG